MRIPLGILVMLLLPLFGGAQVPKDKIIRKADFEPRLEELRTTYGTNKDIPKEFELPILVALSHYPELKNHHVAFLPSPQWGLLAASIRPVEVFKHRSRRQYVVMINTKRTASTMVLEQFSFQEQVGALGHELGHILSFSQQSYVGVSFRQTAQFFGVGITQRERATDRIAIEHGLGWSLYAVTFHILHQDEVPLRYKKRKEKRYLSPNEIIEIIHQLEA